MQFAAAQLLGHLLARGTSTLGLCAQPLVLLAANSFEEIRILRGINNRVKNCLTSGIIWEDELQRVIVPYTKVKQLYGCSS